MRENKMQESLTKVIAEGRSYKGFPVPYAPARAIWLDDFNSFLYRLEAATKREVEKLNSVIQATVSRSDAEIDRLRREVAELRKQIGNAAKLREAVQSILDLAYEAAAETEEPRCKISNDWLIETCNAALAVPARNCDVGTAEDKVERFGEYCISHKATLPLPGRCRRCRIRGEMHVHKCIFEWSQMPYTESEVSHGNA